MDAITLLKQDHRTVEQLFKQFEKAGDRAFSLKRRLVDKVIEDLSKHAAIEEELFYPTTRATVSGVEDNVLESIEEHHIVKWVLSELQAMDSHEESFDAKVTVLIENVRHHVKEEEGDYFPKVRKALGRKTLSDLGNAMAQAKLTAPTRPHPRTPSMPPGNVAVNHTAGMVDRIEDTVGGVATKGSKALKGAIDRLEGGSAKTRPKERKAETTEKSRNGSVKDRHARQVVQKGYRRATISS